MIVLYWGQHYLVAIIELVKYEPICATPTSSNILYFPTYNVANQCVEIILETACIFQWRHLQLTCPHPTIFHIYDSHEDCESYEHYQLCFPCHCFGGQFPYTITRILKNMINDPSFRSLCNEKCAQLGLLELLTGEI